LHATGAVTTIERPTHASIASATVLLVVAVALLAFACGGDRDPAAAPRADIELFSREGCSRCDEAKQWLSDLHARRPDVTIAVTDVGDRAGRRRFVAVAKRAEMAAVGVPAFWVRGKLVVGFAGPEVSGARIEALLVGADGPGTLPGESEAGTCLVEPQAPCGETTAASASDHVALPVFGTVRVSDLGLPLFTMVIGLVDGFNPCAMWMLLFLLSFLAGLRSRRKMLLIAGEFVLVSALAYYALMAAWMAVFSVIGLSRAVQIALGLVGLFVGSVNVKDFFAFHRGLTFSIPESAKPGLYRRMRTVVQAETLPLALAAAAVLAVLVNFIELLCTAGLPALYTQILASLELPAWKRYVYLGLYDVFYMLDDMIMVSIAVVTLGHRKLQERGGRWLKLLSGAVMLTLASILLFRPAWLTRW
jgi:hypothetical protein